MKYKSIFLTICICMNFLIYCQDTIQFALNSAGHVVIKGDKKVTNLKLPATLLFNKMVGQSIEFRDENRARVIALNGKKLGFDPFKMSGDSIVTVVVDDTGRIIGTKDVLKAKINYKLIVGIDAIDFKITDSKTPKDGDKDLSGYAPGYIYYDVMKIMSLDNPVDKFKILVSYGIDDSNLLKNEFLLNSVFGGIDKFKEKYLDTKVKGGTSKIGNFLTNIGNTDVTYFAAGVARFLAERTKEELNEAFFNKMKEKLNAYPELKTAFPNTSRFLNVIETYSYASVIQVLKDAFETDIQSLPEHMYEIKELNPGYCDQQMICGSRSDKECKSFRNCEARMEKLAKYFNEYDGKWTALGMYTAREAFETTAPDKLLDAIVNAGEFKTLKMAAESGGQKHYQDYNVLSSVELSNFISRSLISKENNQIWISRKQLDSLLTYKNGEAFNIYLGLLLSFEQRQDDKRQVIKFYKSQKGDTITFGQILDRVKKQYDEYKPQVQGLIKNVHAACNAANNAVHKMAAAIEKSAEADPRVLYDYYHTVAASVKWVTHNALLCSFVRKDLAAAYDRVENLIGPAVDMSYHIAVKKYSAAIYDASVLLTNLDTMKYETKKTKKHGKVCKKKHDFGTVSKSFIKYGTLIATVANAQSSDEVKEAISASVLPVGSFTIKQKSRTSISLNSYVGGYYRLYKNNSIPQCGLIAPIGFNFSQGLKKNTFMSKYLLMGGYSINLQLLDLGALVNYYSIKGDTASLPNDFKIHLSNIFAPGVSLNYNIKNTPLSLSAGAQYIPTLYSYQQIGGKNNIVPTTAVRFQVALLVDIPMYNLKVWDFRK